MECMRKLVDKVKRDKAEARVEKRSAEEERVERMRIDR